MPLSDWIIYQCIQQRLIDGNINSVDVRNILAFSDVLIIFWNALKFLLQVSLKIYRNIFI